MAAEEKKGLVFVVRRKRPHGQAVKTSPFHGGNTSSILVGVTKAYLVDWNLFIISKLSVRVRSSAFMDH